MKELKSKIIEIRGKHQLVNVSKVASQQKTACYGQPVAVTRSTSQQKNHGIPPLQPRLEPEKLPPSQQIEWQCLEAQAERINKLASELEVAMFELKAIANKIDCKQSIKYKALKPSKHSCKFLAASVPEVKYNKAGGFVLSTRTIDLFRAEREATQVAQQLRRRVKRKRLLSTLSSSKRYLLNWLS